MNKCAIVVLGASGDLAKRKLLPAIYTLIAKKKLEDFVLIGAAFDDVSMDQILDTSKNEIKHGALTKIDESAWQQLRQSSYYQRLEFSREDDYRSLNALVAKLERKHKLSGNRLIYLASSSSFYCTITHNLASSGLAKKLSSREPIWHRIIYEKPFGHDLISAEEINACIARCFYESQIYRIDHYLTKELVSNIALIRFTNCVFEPLWNQRFIDNIQIVASEKLCLEGRGAYYDKYGALRDVVQSHLLELLALVGMEAPEKLSGEYIRDARAKVLKKVRFVDAILGQYDGYRKEENVARDSKTETFAALYLQIDNHRWAGVPFYLKTGKCLDKYETVIHIKFKQVDCLLTKNCPSDSNYLTIRLAPKESFILTLNAKKPETIQELAPVQMEYCHSCLFGAVAPMAHATLLDQIMRGERAISVRFDEIESAWKIIDQIRAKKNPVYDYKKGSAGPKELDDFSKKHGMRWRS